ncbi:MAG: gas vesicle protein [Planctomycetota bacterium]|nr:gas vesicle protein [Planctomycetota bacterium]
MNAPAGENDRISLCETLDRLLNKGAVLRGELTISVAGVDLVYLGFQAVLASVETARTLTRPVETVSDKALPG